jgi:hypothetical protein
MLGGGSWAGRRQLTAIYRNELITMVDSLDQGPSQAREDASCGPSTGVDGLMVLRAGRIHGGADERCAQAVAAVVRDDKQAAKAGAELWEGLESLVPQDDGAS